MSLKDDCKCGHDRTHHYRDPSTGERCNCLAMRCECRWFKDPSKPDPPKPEWAKKKAQGSGYTGPLPTTVWEPPSWYDDDDTGDPPDTPRINAKPHAQTNCICAACKSWMMKKFGYVP